MEMHFNETHLDEGFFYNEGDSIARIGKSKAILTTKPEYFTKDQLWKALVDQTNYINKLQEKIFELSGGK